VTARRAALAGLAAAGALLAAIALTTRPGPAAPRARAPQVAATPAAPAPFAARAEVLPWHASGAAAGADARRASLDDVARAYRAGEAYFERWRRALHAARARHVGEALAQLMDLPIDQAWPALEARLAAGDPLAAEALLDLSCIDAAPEFVTVAARMGGGLDAATAAFVRGALEREYRWRRENAAACVAHGLGDARLAELARERYARDGKTPPDGADPRALFAEAFPRTPQPMHPDLDAPTSALLERVLLDTGTPLGEDEWITLIASADLEPAVAWILGHCVAIEGHCAAFPALGDTDRATLLERGAQAGTPVALDRLVERHRAAGDLVSAYAWALYLRWIAVSGCSPLSMVGEFADVSRTLAALDAELGAAERAAAIAQANALIAAHGRAALGVLGCGP
jgi:hypothetical protein